MDTVIFNLINFKGFHGHYISTHVKNFLTSFYTEIENYLYSDKLFKKKEDGTFIFANKGGNYKPSKAFFKEDFIYEKLIKNDYEFIKLSIYLAEQDLKNTLHETNFSGTTLCLNVLIGDKTVCANVGDSRAIAIQNSENSIGRQVYRVKEISIDHKAETPEEKERIEKMGGEVLRNECIFFI
jgi:hypothetical protein